MVRRTRYRDYKIFCRGFGFLKIAISGYRKPEAAFYELNDKEDAVFTKTIELIAKNSNTLVIPRSFITRAK